LVSVLERFMSEERSRIEAVLLDVLPSARRKPTSVHRAMRYAVLGRGKRLRPVLAVLSFKACGGKGKSIYRVAAALELIHSFTLIHDDLPCMDDDAVRRGKPTVHVVFGEAIALLAGDALLSLAFETMACLAASGKVSGGTVSAMVHEVARAAGTMGVVGGQVVDIESERKRVPLGTVNYIHTHKTGALITCALRTGGLMAGAGARKMKMLTEYGERVGLAFQIVDDMRDVTASAGELGKTRARDTDRGKATYPRVAGMERSLRTARSLAEAAKRGMRGVGAYEEHFCDLADYIAGRATSQEG
jgi:geranylgeranyl diphosphate synthase type II